MIAGMSMVPVADIFNHKAAVIELSGDYVIEPACFGDEDDSGSEDGADEDELGDEDEHEDDEEGNTCEHNHDTDDTGTADGSQADELPGNAWAPAWTPE